MRCRVVFEVEAEELIDGVVRRTGNGACVYVPKTWLGDKVKVIRLKKETNLADGRYGRRRGAAREKDTGRREGEEAKG